MVHPSSETYIYDSMHFSIKYTFFTHPLLQVHTFVMQFRRTPQKFIRPQLFTARDFLKFTKFKNKKYIYGSQWLIVAETLCNQKSKVLGFCNEMINGWRTKLLKTNEAFIA